MSDESAPKAGGSGPTAGPPASSAAREAERAGAGHAASRLLARQADALEQLVYILDPTKRPRKRAFARVAGLLVIGSSSVLGGYEFVSWVLDQWQRRAMISNWVAVAREMQDVENAPEIALELLAKADEVDPQSATVVRLRAYVRGMQAVKKLLQLDRPFKPEDVAMAGAAHAEAALLEQLDPWSADWALLRGQLAMAQNEPIRARRYFERALSLEPDNVLVRVRLAEMLFRAGVAEMESRPESAEEDFLAAARMLDAAIERDRRSKLAWLYKGNHALERSMWDDDSEAYLNAALNSYEEAIAIDDRFELAHRNRAIVLAALGKVDEAEAALNRALEVEPDSCGALTQLSQLYGAKDEYETALLFARKATESNPGSLQAWAWRANVEQDFGKVKDRDGEKDEARDLLDAAVASYGMAIDLDPRSADVRIERSTLQLDLGRQVLAGADARQAVALAPRDPYAWQALAKYQDAIGEGRAALRSLSELLRLDANFDAAHALMAKIQLQSGELAAASRSITAAIEHAEQDLVAQFLASRARIRVELGDVEGALGDAVAARSAEPESFEYWLLEAEILIGAGRLDEACVPLAEANQRKPGTEEIARLRAEAGCD